MTCKECQSMVPDYLGNNLSDRELEEFIGHVRTCPECYEELETYFIIGLATRVLDESEDVSYDIKAMLLSDLREKEEMLVRKRRRRTFLIVFTCILLCVDILMTLHFQGIIRLPFIF